MAYEKSLDELVQEKAVEIAKKQREQELIATVADGIRNIQSAIGNLRQAIELLNKDNNTTKENETKILNITHNIKDNLLYVNEKLITLENNQKLNNNDIKELFKELVSKNNDKSLISQIDNYFNKNVDLLIDLNNDKSLLSQMKKYFNELIQEIKENQKNIMEEFKKKQNIKTWVSFIISSLIGLGTFITIITQLAGK